MLSKQNILICLIPTGIASMSTSSPPAYRQYRQWQGIKEKYQLLLKVTALSSINFLKKNYNGILVLYIRDKNLIRMYCDMTPESQNSSLLGTGLVNTFPRKRSTIDQWRFLWSAPRSLLCSGAVNAPLHQWINTTIEEAVFSMGPAPRLYNEDLTQL
jgi:hypothetical protein